MKTNLNKTPFIGLTEEEYTAFCWWFGSTRGDMVKRRETWDELCRTTGITNDYIDKTWDRYTEVLENLIKGKENNPEKKD